MHLLIDLQSCQSGSRLGGIGRYSLDLAKATARHFTGDRLSILLNDKNPSGEFTVRSEFKDLIPQCDIHIFPQPENCRYIHDDGILASDAALIRNRYILDLDPDVVHVSSLLEGFQEDITTTIDAASPWVNAVTVYDLIPLKQPERYLQDERARTHYLEKVSQFANADVLLGISDFSTREILQELPDFKGVARNILGGIDSRFSPNPKASAQYEDAFLAMGIDRPFILYTASFDLRKNQKGLIEAFSKLPAKLRTTHQLVLVGNGWPQMYCDLRDHARSLGISDGTLVFPGHVSDEILAAFYASCELFVFASLWEGLGMPVLEAMASGVPCIGSNTTSVPEVLGLAEASFDPTNSSEMASLITRVLTDQTFRERLRTHALNHSAKFSWDASAVAALDAIGLATQDRPREPKRSRKQLYALKKPVTTDVADLNELSIAEAKRRLADYKRFSKSIKVGWLTTWEKRCGIATYSRNFIEHFPLPVTILRQQSPGGESFDVGREILTVACWDESKDASLNEVYKALEDLDLTDLVIQFNYGFFNFDQLNSLLAELARRCVNVHIMMHSTSDAFDLPGHRLVELTDGLRACANVLVHSVHDVNRLAVLGVTQNVLLMPLGIRRVDVDSGIAADGQRPNELVVGSYGFFLPTKGLLELINAVRILVDQGVSVRLKLVNACYEDPRGISKRLIQEARDLVATLDIVSHVEFHTEYMTDEDSAALLSTCDIIAFPYQGTGESASAAIRMALAIGRPILTTPLPIFDDVRDLVFQTDGCAPADIALAISRLGAELKAKSDTVQNVVERMRKRASVHDYRKLSCYLARQVAAHSLCRREVLKFTASSSNVRAGQSEWIGDRWVAHSPGTMLHGPYIQLDPGVYAIYLDYSLSESAAGELPTVIVTANNGATGLLKFQLPPQPEIGMEVKHFHVDRFQANVEVLVQSGTPSRVQILGYEIVRTLV